MESNTPKNTYGAAREKPDPALGSRAAKLPARLRSIHFFKGVINAEISRVLFPVFWSGLSFFFFFFLDVSCSKRGGEWEMRIFISTETSFFSLRFFFPPSLFFFFFKQFQPGFCFLFAGFWVWFFFFFLLTCLANTAMSSLKDSEEQTSPPATPGSLGVHVANSHFSKISAKRGNRGCLKENTIVTHTQKAGGGNPRKIKS